MSQPQDDQVMQTVIPLCSIIVIYLWMQITKERNENHSSSICFTLNKQAKKKNAEAIILFSCMI